MKKPSAKLVNGPDVGMFLVKVLVNNKWVDVTEFRGAISKVTSISTMDPFGPASAEIEFPAITSFDRIGFGDISWLKEWNFINIEWSGLSDFVWEGFIASIEIGGSVRIQCKGALYLADNYLAAPFYPTNPVPYEALIKRACHPENSRTGLNGFRVEFPSNWGVFAAEKTDPKYLWMLSPWGISVGQKWTGLATRSTGAWEPYMTGLVQTLLGTMYTPEGDQWTLMLDKGRKPVLRVRRQVHLPDEKTIRVINGTPGIIVNLSKDWSQSANVIYGSGTDWSGVSFSNAQVTSDGKSTRYDPFAFSKAVHPNVETNPYWNKSLVRKEAKLTFAQGVDMVSAFDVASSHLQKFADPGWVGSIDLQIDPVGPDGVPINRFLIQAGDTIVAENWCGADVFLHITKVTASPEDGVTSLSVDSRYRDALTADEVKARTRDALNPTNTLRAGQASITINDLVKPWSYAEGSGIIPTQAKDIFELPEGNEGFPWRNLTKLYPPKDYPQYYVKVSPATSYGRDSCWQRPQSNGIDLPFEEVVVSNGQKSKRRSWAQGIVIRMAQAGTIRLSQIAAYDENGNVLPVEFHFSIFDNTINVSNMPYPSSTTVKQRKNPPGAITQRYPMFEGAFENLKPTGEQQDSASHLLAAGANMVIGWGTYHEAAGYYPGLSSAGNPKTGLMVDESTWSFDTTSGTGFDPYSASKTQRNNEAGCLYGMVYCDDTLVSKKPVYFLGRLYVTPAGSQ